MDRNHPNYIIPLVNKAEDIYSKISKIKPGETECSGDEDDFLNVRADLDFLWGEFFFLGLKNAWFFKTSGKSEKINVRSMADGD